jgi:glutathione S-transferase
MAQPFRIIGSFVSPYVRKVLACCELKGLTYEVDPITPFFGGDEFERISPLRRIPVLIDDDVTLCDSSVICAYLDDAYPQRPLLPSAPADRARARWLEEFADTRLGDVFIWGLFYQRRVHPMVWGESGDMERVERMISEDIPRSLDYLEQQLPEAGFLFGDDIGLAEVSIASFFRNAEYADWTVDAGRWPRVARLVGDTLDHPVFRKLFEYEKVQLSADIKGRRQALLDAGAKLTEETVGTREPRKGLMRL